MNLINNFPKEQRTVLSKIGLNVFALMKNLPNKKRPPLTIEIVYTMNHIIDNVKQNEELIYYDICDSSFLKLETIFKGIWTCKNNIYPSRLVKLMHDDIRRNLFLERLELIQSILNRNLQKSD